MTFYRIFILSCWQEDEVGVQVNNWRYRLEEPRTGKDHGFDDLQKLMLFLGEELAGADADRHQGA